MVRIYKLKPPRNRIRGKTKKSKSVYAQHTLYLLECNHLDVLTLPLLNFLVCCRNLAQLPAQKVAEQERGTLGIRKHFMVGTDLNSQAIML